MQITKWQQAAINGEGASYTAKQRFLLPGFKQFLVLLQKYRLNKANNLIHASPRLDQSPAEPERTCTLLHFPVPKGNDDYFNLRLTVISVILSY